jgi:hypothetical protein
MYGSWLTTASSNGILNLFQKESIMKEFTTEIFTGQMMTANEELVCPVCNDTENLIHVRTTAWYDSGNDDRYVHFGCLSHKRFSELKDDFVCDTDRLTFSKSVIQDFRHDNKTLRYGQAFHQWMKLEKIVNEVDKLFCDRLYNADDTTAKNMITSRTDHNQ